MKSKKCRFMATWLRESKFILYSEHVSRQTVERMNNRNPSATKMIQMRNRCGFYANVQQSDIKN